ncbi:sister chromatid cohesion 1 protein 4-like [Cornus florida]|uniref:sister chromatid cohesion 1 protein 4-like n=1 Tax=Cornus florida TaxID=4283 RepID=UPI00289AD71F|nr:sister chromatid cohesion 1 protein 4-like [Cornus florida]XP_059665650.1 sister chromatid cohesion 1 protein 4-like [Cornus florida]XP_059665651.1 sister chromatid cohesion 1 protein 4-like [Cornus florida]
MFYSQFILAKKGPLGTIWIAAHLERKLRKNQVADTDIGVSVDSILFPDVPIALRLSSHLLLGVVRIYSRKVNYLFDDCSEALLKVKQAFRSTTVDLPPEESTAPYHSITLPETFDLDDFELPDNDIFQGNYVDHHVSAREQITLQDTMEGVVYSTSQFGLDERFGDGDTSGLDLDEELFLENVAAAASGHAGDMLGSGADPQASDQPMSPLKQDENCEGMNDNSEPMQASGSVDQIEIPTENYAQAPCTPGLLEEPNLSNIQEASAYDDHLESEDHNMTEFAAKENLESATSKVDFSNGNKNAVDESHSHMNPEFVLLMPAEENGCLSDGQEVGQLNLPEDFPPTSVNIEHVSSEDPQSALLSSSIIDRVISPVSEFSDKIIPVTDAANRVQDLQNGVANSNDSVIHSIDGAHLDCLEPQGVRLGEIEASPCPSDEAHVMMDSCSNPGSGNENSMEKSSLISTCQPVPEEVMLETDQALLRPAVSKNLEVAGNVEKSSPHSNIVVVDTESSSRHNIEDFGTQACQGQKDFENFSPNVHEEMAFTHMHVLQPCNSHLNQLDLSPGGINPVVIDLPSEEVGLSSVETSGRKEANHISEASNEVQGEGSHATDVIKPVLEGNNIAKPGSNEHIQADFSILDNQVDVTSRDTQLENLDSSEVSELPAPEKLLSVPEGFADLPNNFFPESTPHEAFSMGDDGSKSISGKKRSFTESTLTMQSLNSVKSFGLDLSKRTGESIPDDDDLLSSILVGRKSSALKVKFTPPPENEITSMKRPRSAPRVSASKRKVLLDDNMVLHGDTIRQQLTSTEDIRRVRKKAPCTRPEIWMIRKQLLEDEIFRESIFIGSSTDLESLHSQTYDLSEIRVSQNDENNTSLEAANDAAFSTGLKVTEETGMEGSTEPMVGRNDGEAVPAEPSVLILDQQGLEHVVSSQDCDTQVQVKAVSALPDPRSSQYEVLGERDEMEIDGGSVSVADVVDPVFGDKFDMPAGSTVQLASLDINSGADVSLQLHAAGVSPDEMLDMQHVEMDTFIVDSSNRNGPDAIVDAEKHDDNVAVLGTESSVRNQFLLEEADGCASVDIPAIIHTDCSMHNNSADPSLAISSPQTDGCHNQFVVTVDHDVQEISKQGLVNENEVLAAELDNDDKNPIANGNCGEVPKIDSAYTSELIEDVKNASLNDGESGCQPADSQSRMDAEISAIDHTANEDRGDFDYAIDGHDTGFLNVDDDEVAEEDDNYMSSAIETRFLENSGWSSRTRAVAKYLQTLFDNEAEHGRKGLPMDNLLTGKTRKEASRMFFEALVLKTRDYIHAEQGTPFDSINIKPRGKLMKSDF